LLDADEYRAIFEASPEGIVLVDKHGVMRDVNPQVEALFGWAREELVGEPVEMLVPEVFRTAHREHRKRFVRNPHNRPMGAGMELQGRRKDGSTFSAEISLSPWQRSSDLSDLHVVCSVRDVTERKRLHDFSLGAMRASEEERSRISRELHDDTAQRLATLMLRVRALTAEADDGARQRLGDAVRSEILAAAEGVKRIARGLRPPELEEIGLEAALLAHVRGLREGADFQVHVEVESVDHLLGDEARLALYRVVQEALSNVLRHAGTGRADLKVGVEGGTVFAAVKDQGPGFVPGEARDDDGGLGLTGMQERATMIGGRVEIESIPGQGTTVRLTVPAQAAEAQNV
jgi:PAS domain S-box-containing protein